MLFYTGFEMSPPSCLLTLLLVTAAASTGHALADLPIVGDIAPLSLSGSDW
jgi:hypothetical protein